VLGFRCIIIFIGVITYSVKFEGLVKRGHILVRQLQRHRNISLSLWH
jgi:hypothetical protein